MSDFERYIRSATMPNFERYIRFYGYRPEDLEITDSPGYWRVKEGCPGGENCKHASRIAGIRCDGNTPLSLQYAEWGARDEKGRFVSPHREWRRQRQLQEAGGE